MYSRDRILGCIIGGAIGDAVGAAYEGCPGPVEIDDSIDWVLTDDTQLTLATCEAIVAGRGPDPAEIAARMAAWFRRGQVTAVGASTYKALSELAAGGHWAMVGRRGEMAAGNGAAMRIAPLAFCVDPDDEAGRRTIRDVSRITHHSDEAYCGALAVVAAVSAAGRGLWTGGRGLLASVAGRLPDSRVRDRVGELAHAETDSSLRDLAVRYGSSGYVVESVPLALCAAERFAGWGFSIWFRELIAVGGDTDTIASIAGQVVGCLVRLSGLPPEMVERLPERDMVLEIAEQFADAISAS